MGLLDNVRAFVHSITTDDHYALYDLPYRNSLDPESSRLNADPRLNSSSSTSLTGNVGYTPGLRLNLALLLTLNLGEVPLQPMDATGNVPLPSMDSLWDRIEAWIDNEYPELDDALNLGVTIADLNEFEQDMRCGKLPEDFRLSYKRHDGQMRGGKPTGLLFGLPLLDLEDIAQETIVWKRVVDHLEESTFKASQEAMMALTLSLSVEGSSSKQVSSANNFIAHQRSIPPNSIQPVYYHPGWLPFVKDGEGNQLAIDLAPGKAGHHGQVILFGRDYDTKLVVAPSLQRFLFDFVQDIDAGNYIIDSLEQAEASGYLLISRDDDYMVGDEDEGQGELCFHDCDGKEFAPKTFNDNLTYLDVLKVRALKLFGLAQDYRTAFTPSNIVRSRAPLKRNSAEVTQIHQETLIETPHDSQKQAHLDSKGVTETGRNKAQESEQKVSAEAPREAESTENMDIGTSSVPVGAASPKQDRLAAEPTSEATTEVTKDPVPVDDETPEKQIDSSATKITSEAAQDTVEQPSSTDLASTLEEIKID